MVCVFLCTVKWNQKTSVMCSIWNICCWVTRVPLLIETKVKTARITVSIYFWLSVILGISRSFDDDSEGPALICYWVVDQRLRVVSWILRVILYRLIWCNLGEFRPERGPEIMKFVLKLELGPEICTYILKFSHVFTIFFKNTSFYLFYLRK